MAQCLMKGEWSQLYLEIKGEKKMKENSRKKWGYEKEMDAPMPYFWEKLIHAHMA